jgi:dienelactone hydrolase
MKLSCCAGLIVGLLLSVVSPASSQGDGATPFTEIFYPSGTLRIQAYLYKPSGDGPFPLVIYNHGSREGSERASAPMQFIGRMLTQAGFAVLVPERRGYGKSDGATYSADMQYGVAFITRMQAETDDVIAAVAYLKTIPYVDTTRLGIMGWSLGGIVTMFAASRSNAFKAAVDQAGGALSWRGTPALRAALPAAASRMRIPTLVMDARNDSTTEAAIAVDAALKRAGTSSKLILYDAFTPARNFGNVAPGHLIFSSQGSSIWENDVVTFLRAYLAPPGQ